MASSYTFWDAAHAAEALTAKTVEFDLMSIGANMALNVYWPAYSWRESIADLAPWWVNPGKQDHGAPQIVVPADFFGLKKAYWVDLMSGIQGVPYRRELKVLGDLEETWETTVPMSVCYLPARRSFRLLPRVPLSFGCPRYLVEGQYKRRPTVYLLDGSTVNLIRSENVQSALLPSDDMYMQVWITLMQWAFLKLAGNEKAGGVGMQQGVKVYFGKYGEAIGALDEMAEAEAMALKAQPISPSEPIWGGRGDGSGGFALNNLR